MNALPAAARRCFRSLLSLCLAGFLCCLWQPPQALAAPTAGKATSAELSRIEALVTEAEFETALELVNRELARPGLSSGMTGRLYELQGMLHLYLGDSEAAQHSFKLLLKASPQYRMQEDASPKMQALFEEAREQMAAEISSSLKLAHPRPRPAQPGVPIRLEIQLETPPQGVQAKLFYRRTAGSGFSSTLFVETDDRQKWVAHVPALDFDAGDREAPPAASALESFIEGQDPAGSLLAIAGRREAPLVVPFAGSEALEAATAAATEGEVAESSAWYQKWWVWTIVGVVVAGAVTGGVIYAVSNQAGIVFIIVTLE